MQYNAFFFGVIKELVMELLQGFIETMYYIFKLKIVKDILARDGYFENKPD